MPTPPSTTSEVVLVNIPSIQEIYTSGQQLGSPLSIYSHHSELSSLENNNDGSSDDSITDREELNSSDDDSETEDEHSEENSADEEKEEETVPPPTRKINIPPVKKAIVRPAGAVRPSLSHAGRSAAPRSVPRSTAIRPASRQTAVAAQVRVTEPVGIKASVKPKVVTALKVANTSAMYNPPPPLKRMSQQAKVHAQRHHGTVKKPTSTSYLSPVSESAYDSEVSSSFASSQTSHNYSSTSSIADDIDGSDVASTITALSAVAAGAALAASSSGSNNNKKKSKTSGVMSLAVSTAALVAVAYVAYRIWTHMHAMKGEIEKLKVDVESTQIGRDGVDSAEVEAIARRQIQQLLNEPVNVPVDVPAMASNIAMPPPQNTTPPQQTQLVQSEPEITKVDDDATKLPKTENEAALASVTPIQELQPQTVKNTVANTPPQHEAFVKSDSDSVLSPPVSESQGTVGSSMDERVSDSISDTVLLMPQVNDIDVASIATLPVPETVPVLVSDIELAVVADALRLRSGASAESKDEVIVTPTPPPPAIVPKVTKAAKPTRRKVQITVKDDSQLTEIGNELSKIETATQEQPAQTPL